MIVDMHIDLTVKEGKGADLGKGVCRDRGVAVGDESAIGNCLDDGA